MKASRDRGWAGIAGLALVIAALAWGAAREFQAREARQAGDRGSVFTADASGTRGLFLLLRSEGIPVTAMTRPPSEAIEKGLLVILDPAGNVDAEEAGRIKAWVEDGSALLVVGEDLGVYGTQFAARVSPGTTRGIALATPATGEPALAMATGSDAGIEPKPGLRPLLRRGAVTQAAEASPLLGKAVFVSDAFCATNSGLDVADNAAWWVQTVKRLADGRPVMFLETLHGHLREPSIPEYIQDRGYGPFVLQLLLAGLALLWFLGSRPAPPLAPSSLIRRPVAEYAATMAHLYKGGRAEAHAAKVACEELESLRRRPAWSRKMAKLDAKDREAAEKEAEALVAGLTELSGQLRPPEDVVLAWVSRAASLRRKVTGDDND